MYVHTCAGMQHPYDRTHFPIYVMHKSIPIVDPLLAAFTLEGTVLFGECNAVSYLEFPIALVATQAALMEDLCAQKVL